MKNGVDLSTFNKVTDWALVKDNIDFVMLRAGYGKNNIDQKFIPYATACNENGIPLGLYWFSYAYTVDMAKNEALYCIEQAKKFDIQYPIAFDFEYDSVDYAKKKGITVFKELSMAMAIAFCREIEQAGYIPMIYTNKDYASRYFDIPKLKKLGYSIWYAYYNKTVDRQDIEMWQHTSSGSLPGVAGNVDRNISYVDYSGNKVGWIKEGAYWYYIRTDGSKCKDCWLEVCGDWYHFDPDGVMQTGWLLDEGLYYFLKKDGVMARKEMLIIPSEEHGEEKFIFDEDGHLLYTNDRGAVIN